MGFLSKILQAFFSRFEAAPGESAAELVSAGAVLVDVRTEGEFAAGHIEGALWLPLDRLERDIARAIPDPARPLILYCRSGARSGHACTLVSRLGYGKATNGGGYRALAASLNRPIVTGRRRDG